MAKSLFDDDNIIEQILVSEPISNENKKYPPNTFTYGYEIEWGDIDRKLIIPEHLGKWEYCETDVCNIYEPYRYVASDPLGISPPFGGEINTKPTKTWREQVDRIMEIYDLFVKHGNTPSSACVNEGHIHIFIPGLKEDVDALKRLIKYIQLNQKDTIKACNQFKEYPGMKFCDGAKMYLKLDIGREIPEFRCNNIINLSTNFESFIKQHYTGKDGISIGMPIRYAINTYCMKHTGTIEFRCFRSSIKREEIESQFRFVERFMCAALNDGKSVEEILKSEKFTFPPFTWNKEEYCGWKKTKYPKSRGEKHREYHEII